MIYSEASSWTAGTSDGIITVCRNKETATKKKIIIIDKRISKEACPKLFWIEKQT